MTGMIQLQVTGIENLMKRLGRTNRQMKGEITRTLREVGTDGMNFARSRAPVFTGELQSKIIAFPQSHNVWVVASNPTNDGFPLNVAFDEGNFGNMSMWGRGRAETFSTGQTISRGVGGRFAPISGVAKGRKARVPFRPRNPSLNIGFMKKTSRKMRRDLNDKLRIRIERLIAEA